MFPLSYRSPKRQLIPGDRTITDLIEVDGTLWSRCKDSAGNRDWYSLGPIENAEPDVPTEWTAQYAFLLSEWRDAVSFGKEYARESALRRGA